MQSPAVRGEDSSPVCDSDEEVFFGPVTSKELQRASRLHRRTELFFPGVYLKPRFDSNEVSSQGDISSSETALRREEGIAHNVKDRLQRQDKGEEFNEDNSTPMDAAHNIKPEEILEKQIEQVCLDMSADSIENNLQPPQKFFEFFPAHSVSSLDHCSVPTQDTVSVASEHSKQWLDIKPQSSQVCFQTIHSVPEDSKDLNSELSHSVAQICNDGSNSDHVPSSNEFTNPQQSVDNGKTDSPIQKDMHPCSLKSGNVSRSSLQPHHTAWVCSVGSEDILAGSDSVHDVELENVCRSQSSLNVAAFEVVSENSVDSLQNTCESGCVQEDKNSLVINASESKNSPLNEVIVDKDGGFLSILSEAALYHASQQKQDCDIPNERQYELHDECRDSLEDRFKDFGISSDDLERQQLTESILYTTGRESCFVFNTSSFLPSHHVPPDMKEKNRGVTKFVEPDCFLDNGTKPVSFLEKVEGSKKNQGDAAALDEISHNSDSTSQTLPDNQLYDRGSSQATETPISGHAFDKSLTENHTKAEEDLCGVWEEDEYSGDRNNDSVEMYTAHSDIGDTSATSSISEKMNDTLEEYEMMMRYGVDYILGNVKEHKGSHRNLTEAADEGSSISYYDAKDCARALSPSSSLSESKVASPHTPSQYSTKVRQALTPCPPLYVSNVVTSRIQAPQPSLLKPGMATKTFTPKTTPSAISKVPCAARTPSFRHPLTPSPQIKRQGAFSGATAKSCPKLTMFKKPFKPLVPASRIPKCTSSSTSPWPKSNQKVLSNIQSPVSAYIHNTPSPILVKNIKAKEKDCGSLQNEMLARALWKSEEAGSKMSQVTNTENVNPNVRCGLPAVKYTRAPCIKLGEPEVMHFPKVNEKISKLLDTPCPQVIKHEGRLNIKAGSPQLAARVQAVANSHDDSMAGVGATSGDISVCVTNVAVRTNTLGHRSPLSNGRFNSKF